MFFCRKKNVKFTHSIVLVPCMKKSTADTIIVDPTILVATIVINLTHNNVVTAKMIAPPPTATVISCIYRIIKNSFISFILCFCFLKKKFKCLHQKRDSVDLQ